MGKTYRDVQGWGGDRTAPARTGKGKPGYRSANGGSSRGGSRVRRGGRDRWEKYGYADSRDE